jgi:hypothetical protein
VRHVVSQLEVLARAAQQAPTDRLRRRIEAQRLAVVGLFGRGFEQLRPVNTNVSAAEARSLAALAYRAGATDVARQLLGDVPPGEQRALFDAWALSMGWKDAPVDGSADREYESMLGALLARQDVQ